jgi:hypothetical protein
MAASKWVKLDVLARAWATAEGVAPAFEKALAKYLKRGGSYYNACKDALHDAGLKRHARHLIDLMGVLPFRPYEGPGLRPVEIDLAGQPTEVPPAPPRAKRKAPLALPPPRAAPAKRPRAKRRHGQA